MLAAKMSTRTLVKSLFHMMSRAYGHSLSRSMAKSRFLMSLEAPTQATTKAAQIPRPTEKELKKWQLGHVAFLGGSYAVVLFLLLVGWLILRKF
jgi:hypothetical protein